MKSTVILASLCATVALANPVKRGLKTAWVFQTVTVTVTGGTVPTPPVANGGQFYGVPGTTSSAVVVPTTTQLPPPVVETPTVKAPAVETPAVVAPAPAASPPSSAPVVVPSPNTGSAPDAYSKLILEQHNNHRANHSASALTWSAELAGWASELGNKCEYGHSRAQGDGKYGQNIGAGTPPTEVGQMITNSMYNGEMTHYKFYGKEPDEDQMRDTFGQWGHFSQIVWVETTEIGCATIRCGKLKNVGDDVAPWFTVCNYRPAGNFGGRYAANVLAPKGMASVVL